MRRFSPVLLLATILGCAGQIDVADAQDVSAVSLSIAPPSVRMEAVTGGQPSAAAFTLRNGGSKRAGFVVFCSDGAEADPGLGNLGSGASQPVSVFLPAWWTPGLHAIACYAHGQGSSKEPVFTVLAAVADEPSDGGFWDGGNSWDGGSWDAGSSDAGHP